MSCGALWGIFASGVVGLFGWVLLLFRERQEKGALVLLYHRLHPNDKTLSGSEALFSVSPSLFAEQLDALRDAGWTFLTPKETLRCLNEKQEFPEHSLAIAFDDGCESIHALAAPILEERGLAALVFITADPEAFVFHLPGNEQGRMGPEQIQELRAKGWHFGLHGWDHTPPSSLSEEDLREDFKQSIQWLQEMGVDPVEDYAVPGNFMGESLREVATEMGVKRVWSASPGTLSPSVSLLGIPRMGVEGTSSGVALVRSLSIRGRVARKLLSGLKRLPVRLLGAERWLPVRRFIFRLLSPWNISRHFWFRAFWGFIAFSLVLSAWLVSP